MGDYMGGGRNERDVYQYNTQYGCRYLITVGMSKEIDIIIW